MNVLARASVCVTAAVTAGTLGHHQMAAVSRPLGTMRAERVEPAAPPPLARLAAGAGWAEAATFPGRLNGRRILLSVYETPGSTPEAAARLRAAWRALGLGGGELDLGALVVLWSEQSRPCRYAMAIRDAGRARALVFFLRSDGPLRIPPGGCPGDDLRGVPAYPGQRRWLRLDSADGRLAVAVYRVPGPPATVKAFLGDQLRGGGWRDLLPTREPGWSGMQFPLMAEDGRGGFCLFSFLPLPGGAGTTCAVARWRALEDAP